MKVKTKHISHFEHGEFAKKTDLLAIEEPLEIQVQFGKTSERKEKSLAITMRTPDHDLELVLGFLYSEHIISSYDDISQLYHCQEKSSKGNVVKVFLKPELDFDIDKLNRHFYTTSSCGVCGKASIEAIHIQCHPILKKLRPLSPEIICSLSDIVRKEQVVFKHTGGLHAVALFDQTGKLLVLREDIGRHNAMDKVIGSQLFEKKYNLADKIIWLSGRASFELLQKAIRSNVGTVVAVGAPSSLAVELAQDFDVRLIGFCRKNKFNCYTKH